MNGSASNSGGGGSATGTRKRLCVVVVHYRTPGLLRDCLDTLATEVDAARDEVIVVDNASGDGSLPAVEEACRRPGVRLIASKRNLGFAGANNVGIEACDRDGGAEYYMLLNPDTLVRPGAFALLLEFMRERPEAALVGPRLEHRDGTPQLSAFGDHRPMSELIRGANVGPISRALRRWRVYGEIQGEAHRTDWLAGACLVIRREVFERVGLLDAGYFMYYEEADFCRRARLAGFESWYYPTPRVVHLVGQSSGVTNEREARRLPRYWFESRHRYFRKNFGYLGAVAADGFWLMGQTINMTRRLFTGVTYSSCAKRETRDFIAAEARQLFTFARA